LQANERVATRREKSAPAIRIIIPARNEAGRIAPTVEKFCRYFGSQAVILVVVNGCTDGTATVVRNMTMRFANLELLEISEAVGKGGAVRAGLTFGDEPYVAFVDADGSATASELERLLLRCRDNPLAGVIGSRWMRKSRIARRQPFQRRLASRTFNFITRLIFRLPYTDTQCGAKVFRREAVDRVIDTLEISNFAFDVDLLLALKRLRLPVAEIPITWDDVAEYSKVTLLRSGSSMLWALLRLWIRESVFATIPFVDALGRSETIPVREGLMVLVLLRSEHLKSEMLDALLHVLRQRQHKAEIVILDDVASRVRFAIWYASEGHFRTDAMVHAFGKQGQRVLRFSAKPKFLLQEFAEDADDGDVFVRRMMASTSCPTYFSRNHDGWSLSANALKTSRTAEHERNGALTNATAAEGGRRLG